MFVAPTVVLPFAISTDHVVQGFDKQAVAKLSYACLLDHYARRPVGTAEEVGLLQWNTLRIAICPGSSHSLSFSHLLPIHITDA
jgi:hypothetical protein